jgi:hypothetical protein
VSGRRWYIVVFVIMLIYYGANTQSEGDYIVTLCVISATRMDYTQIKTMYHFYIVHYRLIWSKNYRNPRSVAKVTAYTTTGYISLIQTPTKMQLVNFYSVFEDIKNILSLKISNSGNPPKDRVKRTNFE